MTRPIIASLWLFDAAAVRAMAAPEPVEVCEARPGCSTEDLVRDADVVLADPSGERALDRLAIEAMRRCRLIQQPSVGVDTIDVAAAAARGIPVANTAGTNSRAVAEWVVMAALTLLRDGHHAHQAMQGGGWPSSGPSRELGSLTVGLVGMGNAARAVARMVAGFGPRVLFHHHRAIGDAPAGATQVPLDELLIRSDVVSLHVPLTSATRGLLNARRLAGMKPDAVIVNTSRGAVVEESALLDWLAASPDRRAALDVFGTEPLPADAPLRRSAQVLLSPHAAARTVDARRRLAEAVAVNVRRVLAGEDIVNRVDLEGRP